MKLVPNQNAAHGRLVLLAPPQAPIPPSFAKVEINPRHHEHFLRGVQRLRGKLYREDGAIRDSELSRDGRHLHPSDGRGWHLLSLDRNGDICGCSRYVTHPNTVTFSQLGIREAALAHSQAWGTALRTAVDAEIAQARRGGLGYAEVGGWALDPSMRRTAEAVRIALATYSLARLLGGCIGITTATTRHCSAAILRRIGGQPLRTAGVELPPYYDPQFECEMELLRFDSGAPNPRFEVWIDDLRQYLTATLVLQSEPQQEDSPHLQVTRAHRASGQMPRGFGQHLVHAVQ